MSTHEILIITIDEVLPHPNADKLQICKIGEYVCCSRINQFKADDKAIFVPPDFNVPVSHPSFAFLAKAGKDKQRIAVKRLRGELSQGLLIDVPSELADLPVGSNVITQLGITRYEPEFCHTEDMGLSIAGPSGITIPKFDVENWQKYANVFIEGEEIICSEKINGQNWRAVYAADKDGVMKQFVGSRSQWKEKESDNIFWPTFHKYPQIGKWCQDHPNIVLYGEQYGHVKGMNYDASKNDRKFLAFAVLKPDGKWTDWDEMVTSLSQFQIPVVPVVYRGNFNKEKMKELAEGPTLVKGATGIREGICVVPLKERWDSKLGRVILKFVSNAYLEGNY
jgi:RNA ligase (TIGR02306 family)